MRRHGGAGLASAGSVDLLWSEGAIDFLGFEAGLRLWRPLLTPRGCLAASECSWLCADRPAEAAAFFHEGYPGMAGIQENIERTHAAGFDVIDHFTLPPEAWWDEYYTPLEQRMARLSPPADPELAALIRRDLTRDRAVPQIWRQLRLCFLLVAPAPLMRVEIGRRGMIGPGSGVLWVWTSPRAPDPTAPCATARRLPSCTT